MENRAPWQVHTMAPPSTLLTGQAECVQVRSNALNTPAVGWVTTKRASGKTMPPPTGTLDRGTWALVAPVPTWTGLLHPVAHPAPTATAAKPAARMKVRRSVMPYTVAAKLTVGAAA